MLWQWAESASTGGWEVIFYGLAENAEKKDNWLLINVRKLAKMREDKERREHP
jgi:lysylphosphatidylglycerol synthetase-like protein (DUF2156 family)